MGLIDRPIKKSSETLRMELEDCRRYLAINYLLDRQRKALEKRVKEIETELKLIDNERK